MRDDDRLKLLRENDDLRSEIKILKNQYQQLNVDLLSEVKILKNQHILNRKRYRQDLEGRISEVTEILEEINTILRQDRKFGESHDLRKQSID